MVRSLKFSLQFSNSGKLAQLDALSKEYKNTVNYFLKRLFQKKDLSEDFLKLYQSPLSYAYKQCAKRRMFAEYAKVDGIKLVPWY